MVGRDKMKRKRINLTLEVDKDGNGCGTLVLHERIYDGYYTLVVATVDAEQVGRLKEFVGDYHKD